MSFSGTPGAEQKIAVRKQDGTIEVVFVGKMVHFILNADLNYQPIAAVVTSVSPAGVLDLTLHPPGQLPEPRESVVHIEDSRLSGATATGFKERGAWKLIE